MTTGIDYEQWPNEKLIEEAAKRLLLGDLWIMLAKRRMTLPANRESMRSKIIKNLKLLDEYTIQ